MDHEPIFTINAAGGTTVVIGTAAAMVAHIAAEADAINREPNGAITMNWGPGAVDFEIKRRRQPIRFKRGEGASC